MSASPDLADWTARREALAALIDEKIAADPSNAWAPVLRAAQKLADAPPGELRAVLRRAAKCVGLIPSPAPRRPACMRARGGRLRSGRPRGARCTTRATGPPGDSEPAEPEPGEPAPDHSPDELLAWLDCAADARVHGLLARREGDAAPLADDIGPHTVGRPLALPSRKKGVPDGEPTGSRR
jgi:hypothetical protein